MAAVFAARRASMFSPHGMGERVHEMGEEKRRQDEHGGSGGGGGHGSHHHNHGGGGYHAEDEYEDVVEESNVDIGDVIAYAKLKKYDKQVRRRNLIHLILAVISAAAFQLEIWLAYDEGACWRDWNPADGSSIDDSNKPFCMKQTSMTIILKGIISICTFTLIVMIVDYYRFQLKSERNAYWFLTDSIFWRKHMWFFCALEIIVILPHPFPTGYEPLYDDKLGSLMFLRLYLFVRVLRDHSPIYRKRKQLLNDTFLKKSGAVEFNWLLCVKFLFLRHMWAFVVWGVVITWFTMAYVIWIFEREHNQSFTLDIAVWMTCITMSTVGYGDITPTNASAKVAAGFTAVFGIILAALLVFAVMDALTLSPQDTRVRNLWTKKLTFDKQKVAASAYVRIWWEHYKNKQAIPDRKSPEFRAMLLEFNAKNAYLKGLLRTCRRDLAMAMELDDLVIDRLEERMTDMTGNIADRLAYRLGLRPSRRKKSLSSILELKERVDSMESEQKKILAKIDQILKVLLSSNGNIFTNMFS